MQLQKERIMPAPKPELIQGDRLPSNGNTRPGRNINIPGTDGHSV